MGRRPRRAAITAARAQAAVARAASFRDPLRFTEHRDADGEAYFREACAKGWEGVIAKRADSPYRPGRTRDWLRVKCENGQEFIIGGYTDPQRSRIGFGALLLGYYDRDGKLRYAGKVGTGFDQRTLISLPAALAALERPDPPFEPVCGLPGSGVHWVKPRLVAPGRLHRMDRRRAAAPP